MTGTAVEEDRRRTLYVFMDESGDLQFGRKASQHFILSAVYTDSPQSSAAAMQELKYSLLASGSTDLEFHATYNSRGTRKRVIDTIVDIEAIRIHTLWIDKAFTAPALQNEIALLGQFGKSMGRWISSTHTLADYDQVVLIFDSVLTGKKQDAFLKLLKPELATLPIPYRVLFHPVKQDLNGQIADYFSWSWFRNIEHKDPQYCEALQRNGRWTQFNLFRNGNTRYWSRPL